MRLGQIEVGGEGLGRKVLGGVAPRRFTGRTRCGGVTEEADGGRSSHVNDAPGRLLLVACIRITWDCCLKCRFLGPTLRPPNLRLLGQESAF